MSYPAVGDPVYLPMQHSANLASGLFFATGTGECVNGPLRSDCLVMIDVSGFRGARVEADGSLTISGSFTTIPDPGGTGPSSMSTTPVDAPGYFTANTTVLGGGSDSVDVRKFVVDPVTLAISQQDIDTHVYTNPYSFHLNYNQFADVLFDVDDHTGTQVSHEVRIIPNSPSGLGTRINATLDSTGLTGFDIGIISSIDAQSYFTQFDRYFQVTASGTVVTDVQNADATLIDFNDNWNCYAGLVPGYFYATGGPTEDVVGTIVNGVVTATHPVSGLIHDLGGKFPGELWFINAIWMVSGKLTVTATNTDGLVTAMTTDALGTPTTYFMRDGDGVSTIWANGLTADGRVFCFGQDPTGFIGHYATFSVGPPVTPVYYGDPGTGVGMLDSGAGTKHARRKPVATSGLNYLGVEVSFGSRWININDGDTYKIAADSTRDSTAKTWRKVTANSPILGGDYLIHAVPEMVSEQIGVWVYGQDQTEVADNLFGLTDLFEQYDFRIRWTFDEYREYWRCQLADATISRGQVWTHSLMAKAEFTVPRYPEVTRERI